MKNIYLLNGKPLIAYTIEAALASKVDTVVVSTDNKEIATVAKNFGALVINRPKELAQDTTPTLPVIQHALNEFKEKFQLVITLQPTSPLRSSHHIDSSIDLFNKHKEADSLVSIIKVPHNMIPDSIMKIDNNGYLMNYLNQEDSISRRQDKDDYFARNGAAIYISKIQNLKKYIFGGKVVPFLMNMNDSIDIDTYDDILQAENFLKIKKLN